MRIGEEKISFVLAAVFCAVIMLSSKAFLLFLVFFCSTSFSLMCYDALRSAEENRPITAKNCSSLHSTHCVKIHSRGWMLVKGDKEKTDMFQVGASCATYQCQKDGCVDSKHSGGFKEFEDADVVMTFCCCTGDFCFSKDDVEKFMKEKSGHHPLLFIPLLVLLL